MSNETVKSNSRPQLLKLESNTYVGYPNHKKQFISIRPRYAERRQESENFVPLHVSASNLGKRVRQALLSNDNSTANNLVLSLKHKGYSWNTIGYVLNT